MVFRKEAELLVVLQAACSKPKTISWAVIDFPKEIQGNTCMCVLSKMKMVPSLLYFESKVVVFIIEAVLLHQMFTHCCLANHKPKFFV